MKKNYVNAELEIIFLASKDVLTTSVDSVVFDPDHILEDEEKLYTWEW